MNSLFIFVSTFFLALISSSISTQGVEAEARIAESPSVSCVQLREYLRAGQIDLFKKFVLLSNPFAEGYCANRIGLLKDVARYGDEECARRFYATHDLNYMYVFHANHHSVEAGNIGSLIGAEGSKRRATSFLCERIKSFVKEESTAQMIKCLALMLKTYPEVISEMTTFSNILYSTIVTGMMAELKFFLEIFPHVDFAMIDPKCYLSAVGRGSDEIVRIMFSQFIRNSPELALNMQEATRRERYRTFFILGELGKEAGLLDESNKDLITVCAGQALIYGIVTCDRLVRSVAISFLMDPMDSLQRRVALLSSNGLEMASAYLTMQLIASREPSLQLPSEILELILTKFS